MGRWRRVAFVFALSGCLTFDGQSPAASSELDHFRARIAAYVQLRHQAGAAPLSEPPANLEQHLARRERCRELLRTRRSQVGEGSVFDANTSRLFRAVIGDVAAKRPGQSIQSLSDRHLGQEALRAAVNERYPMGASHYVSPGLLLGLPALPRGIEYRIAGDDLVLWDPDVDLVIDVLRWAFSVDAVHRRAPGISRSLPSGQQS